MWFTIALQILQILPQVIKSIKTLEAEFGAVPGEAKKAMIVDTISQTVKDVGGAVMKPEDAAILSSTINNAVSVANRFGILKTNPPSDAAAK